MTQNGHKNSPSERLPEYVRILSEMVNCKTVFDEKGENKAEFEKFYSVIEENFPNLSRNAERITFGSGCFAYKISGANPEKNVMIMSHHDVVDSCPGWETDAFTATEKDGFLFGRGTIDTKTPLFAELMAAEELLAEGYDFPGINLWIGSSNNEECSGDGMVLAAEYFKKNGIHFETVLDEGGAITEGMIPGVKCKSAVIAVHEKSRHRFICRTSENSVGHGSFSKKTATPAENLCRFVAKVSTKSGKIYKPAFSPEVRATFERHVPYMSFPMNFLFGNIGIFAPVIKKIMLSIPAASAMLTTSVSFTALSTETKPGAQKSAEATMYLRCIREDDLYRGLEKIKDIAKKYNIEIEETLRDYCRPTDFNAEPFRKTEALLHENFPDVAVAPFLLTAGTDARRLTDVADNILRFAPIDLSKSQFASIHGANECISINNIGECVRFYKDFIRII
ncbi:MAG: M20/M25/M40 family metallo-hydrolase [Oscillospiraceae bacterium]|nr:M20/M25/M40 family metallo-hydrolase [Oscillospiraceae bacterium]